MKKVFIIHGFEGSPNGWWRPWLMAELEKQDIYTCALSLPNSENPVCSEWVDEIQRHTEYNKDDQIYLIGHSLWGPAILRYLEKTKMNNTAGVILVSSPSTKNKNSKLDSFLEWSFDFEEIRSKCKRFSVIHGDNDPLVPRENAQFLSEKLWGGELVIVKGGGHLNGSAGCFELPQCLEVLNRMMD